MTDLSAARAVVWNTAGLELPTVDEEYVAHLHHQTTPRQRAGAGDLRVGRRPGADASSSPVRTSPTCWWWKRLRR